MKRVQKGQGNVLTAVAGIEDRYNCRDFITYDVRGSVHCDIIMKTTNEMQVYRLIYYS